jgi:hypothetical protein
MALYDVANVVGYYRFNEGEGDVVNSCIANDIYGDYEGLWSNTPKFGTYCLDTSGAPSTNGVTFPVNKYAFLKTQPFSISMWVKFYGYYDGVTPFKTQQLFSNIIGSGYDLLLTDYNLIYFRMFGGGGGGDTLQAYYDSAPVLNNNNWNNVVATYNGSGLNSGLKLYINGSVVSTTNIGTLTGELSAGDNTLRIGNSNSFPSTTNNIDGLIDETVIWNKELTSTEVSTLYNSGNGNTLIIKSPTGLTITNVSDSSLTINWLPSTNDQFIDQYAVLRYIGLNYETFDEGKLVLSGNTHLNVNQLSGNTPYSFHVIGAGNCTDWDSSNKVSTYTLPYSYPSPFCEGTNYTAYNATCDQSVLGAILIPLEYDSFYEFYLTDSFGNSYTDSIFDDDYGGFLGLLPDYYFLRAVVKPEFWDVYGREECNINWIQVNAEDTSMSLSGTSVKPNICGGFGAGEGRIAYNISDTDPSAYYDAFLYNSRIELIHYVRITDISQLVFTPLIAGVYYLYVIGGNGCTFLVPNILVEGVPLRSVAGIRRLWLTQWNNLIQYNYWSQSDDEYYLSGLDANFFNSIKISNFVDSSLVSPWYSVNISTKSITYSQVLNKTRQGFIFSDKLVLTIPEADNDKWNQLTDILQNRYILVIEDNNGLYWTMGYRYGAKIGSYTLSNNEYVLEFQAVSENKILTNLNEDYVKSSIL